MTCARPEEPGIAPLKGFEERHLARLAKEEEYGHRNENGDTIEPCTMGQIENALQTLSRCPENKPWTRHNLLFFRTLKNDIHENLEHGTDVNFDSVSKDAISGYLHFLSNHVPHPHKVINTEFSTLIANWGGK